MRLPQPFQVILCVHTKDLSYVGCISEESMQNEHKQCIFTTVGVAFQDRLTASASEAYAA